MTVRDLYVSGCCFGTRTIISIATHVSNNEWKTIYKGCWNDMPENIRDKKVDWFDIWQELDELEISVERG